MRIEPFFHSTESDCKIGFKGIFRNLACVAVTAAGNVYGKFHRRTTLVYEFKQIRKAVLQLSVEACAENAVNHNFAVLQHLFYIILLMSVNTCIEACFIYGIAESCTLRIW